MSFPLSAPCISAVFLSWGCLWACLGPVQRTGYFFSSQMTLIYLAGNMQLCYVVQIVQIHLPFHWATYSLFSSILFLTFISSGFYFLHGLFLPPCLAMLLIQVHGNITQDLSSLPQVKGDSTQPVSHLLEARYLNHELQSSWESGGSRESPRENTREAQRILF